MALSILIAFTAVIAVMTLLPATPIPHGFVRVCDFPRLQIAGVAAVLVVLTLTLLRGGPAAFLLIAVQISTAAVQVAVCLRFTPLWRVQSLAFEGNSIDPSIVRILTANVKMSNRDYSKLLRLVEERDPHIAVLLEVDDNWLSALAPLRKRLPFSVEQPQDNAYGMVLLSRLRLVEPAVRFLVMDEIPSIKCAVALPDGRQFRLHVLHPEPPLPNADTLERDGELIMTAHEAKSDPMPAVVTGDLNDVAWSRTTRRFQRLSGLLDPRIGRGFYNTFDARFPLLRWPLDHLFHDARFRLVGLERLPHIGSDHFPMLFELALTEEEAAGEPPDKPHGGDLEEARDVVHDASRLEREPIGADWEK